MTPEERKLFDAMRAYFVDNSLGNYAELSQAMREFAYGNLDSEPCHQASPTGKIKCILTKGHVTSADMPGFCWHIGKAANGMYRKWREWL